MSFASERPRDPRGIHSGDSPRAPGAGCRSGDGIGARDARTGRSRRETCRPWQGAHRQLAPSL